jgi:tetratricopeptide (TPR) repeat protein
MLKLQGRIFRFSLPTMALSAIAATVAAIPAFAQETPCPTIAAHEPSTAETAYAQGKFVQAEDLYAPEFAAHPLDLRLGAAIVHAQLHMGEVAEADGRAHKLLAENPASAIALTTLAEVQLRQGQPWLALETLKKAESADPCYARIHLIRSKVFRIDSMYATERVEIQKANDIDPTDPDIHHAWARIISPAEQVDGVSKALATMKDLDEESRKRAEQSSRELLPLLTENNQTCQILPSSGSATLPLLPVFQDAKHIEGYRLEVELPKTKVRLMVDTAASGLFISRALADQNGFTRSGGAPPGTVHADSFRIGPLEFRDCIVGVNEAPFAGNADGFIGTDIFTNYLITLNLPAAKLALTPLPPQPGVLPGDRVTSQDLQGFTPVYHQRQFLLVPATLNNKSRQLFLLDSGIRFSTMIPEVAHSVSTTKVNFTNPVQTVSGSTLQVYRDSFDFQLANLSLSHQSHILEMESPSPDMSSSVQIAGKLGFDMLHSLILRLDYRDGLIQLESPEGSSSSETTGTISVASSKDHPSSDCGPADERDRPVESTILAKVTGLIDSSRLKVGKEFTIKVVNEYSYPGCTLAVDSVLYGHATEVNSSKGPGSELALVFDHGDCEGQFKKPLSLNLIAMIAPPDQYVGMHSALPNQVAGGGRAIAAAAANTGLPEDFNLNPGGPPKTMHVGMVSGIPQLKLEPQAGPGCSARISSTEHSVHLGIGAMLLLTMQSAPNP